MMDNKPQAVNKKKGRKRSRLSLTRCRTKRQCRNKPVGSDIGDSPSTIDETPNHVSGDMTTDQEMKKVEEEHKDLISTTDKRIKKKSRRYLEAESGKTKDAAKPEGCLEIEFPLTTLQSCMDSQFGHVMYLAGTVKKGRCAPKSIEIKSQRKKNSMCFQLLTSEMGPVFEEKLQHKWKCLLSDICISSGKLDIKCTKSAIDNEYSVQPHNNQCKAESQKVGYADENCKSSFEKCTAVNQNPENVDHLMDQNASEGDTAELYDIMIKHEISSHDDFLGEVGLTHEKVTSGEVINKDLGDCADDLCEASSSSKRDAITLAMNNARNQIPKVKRTKKFQGRRKNRKKLTKLQVSKSKRVEAIGVNEEHGKVKEKDVMDQITQGDANSDQKVLVSCRFCEKLVPSSTHLRKHANYPEFVIPHEVGDCGRNPWSRTSVQPKPTVSEKFPFGCKFCKRGFIRESGCARHEKVCPREPAYMTKFDKEAMGLSICDICDIMSCSQLGLMQHRRRFHGFQKPFPSSLRRRKPVNCRFCGQLLLSHSQRSDHELYKCDKNPNVAQSGFCSLCGYKCAKGKLGEHMAKHGPEEHICEVCGKVCISKRRLYAHRIRHPEVAPPRFSCKHCNKMYLFKDKLERHMSLHTGERNIQCAICGKCFKNKHQESKHRISVHENRYAYRCEKCGHGMEKKVYLKNHKCGRVRRVQNGPVHKETVQMELIENVQLQNDTVQEKTHASDLDLSVQNLLDNVVKDESSSLMENEKGSLPEAQNSETTEQIMQIEGLDAEHVRIINQAEEVEFGSSYAMYVPGEGFIMQAIVPNEIELNLN